MVKKFLVIPFLVFSASYALPFVYWPEMLNWPFFINHGWLPYKDIAIVHTPFLLGFLTVFYNLLGFNTWTLHLVGSLLLAFTAFLVGLMTKKYSSQIIFGLLALAMSGNTVWFESLLAPILLSVFWSFKKKKYVLAGILFGVALVTKQTVGYLLPLIALPFLKQRPKKLIFFAVSALIPIIFLYLWLNANNLITDFWRWGIQFVFLQTSHTSSENSYVLLPTIKQAIFVGGIVLIPLILSRNIAFVWMVFSLLFAVPRFDFFHLVPFAAFFAISIGTANIKPKYLVLVILICLVFFVALTNSILMQDHSFLDKNTLMVATYVKNNLRNKTVFFLNSYDQIYFLDNIMPAVKPWVPQLPWYFGFYGDEFLSDIQKSRPQIIIVSPYLNKAVGGLGAYQPPGVLEYIQQNYLMTSSFSEGTKVYERL